MSEKWTVIIAGGRDADEAEALAILDRDLKPENVQCVVSGCAKGWDAAGWRWALKHGIDLRAFPAEWQRWGNAAGPKRNEEMAAFAAASGNGAAFLGPGGSGTADMRRRAKAHGLRILSDGLRGLSARARPTTETGKP